MKQWAVFCLLGVLLATAGYSHFIEPNRLLITHFSVKSPRLKSALAGRRLVFVSDLHIGTKKKVSIKKLAKAIRELDPDFLIFGGDLMEYHGTPEPVIEWFKTLPGSPKAFAVLGDTDITGGARNCAYCHHPGKKSLRSDLPVRFLRQEFEIVEMDSGKVIVAGTDPEWIDTDLSFLEDAPPGLPVILISHYPEALDPAAAAKVDLVLAGDTHGGQIIAPKIFFAKFFREGRANYLAGGFEKGGTEMYVTRGIGTSIVPFRLGVPPEVVVIDF